jgi:hypothetical protein
MSARDSVAMLPLGEQAVGRVRLVMSREAAALLLPELPRRAAAERLGEPRLAARGLLCQCWRALALASSINDNTLFSSIGKWQRPRLLHR